MSASTSLGGATDVQGTAAAATESTDGLRQRPVVATAARATDAAGDALAQAPEPTQPKRRTYRELERENGELESQVKTCCGLFSVSTGCCMLCTLGLSCCLLTSLRNAEDLRVQLAQCTLARFSH